MRQKRKRFADNAVRRNVIEEGKELYTGIKGNWNKIYFQNTHKITLELACGRGEYTVGLAEKFPKRNFIGIDLKGDRIWKGSGEAIEKGLENVAFLRTNILELEDFFKPSEVNEIWVMFPDPRPKDRDERRRIMNQRFIDIYKNILAKDSFIKLKTDNSGFFEYSLEVLSQRDDIKNLSYTEDLYNSALNADHFGLKTRYEGKFTALGNTIKYLKFQFLCA